MNPRSSKFVLSVGPLARVASTAAAALCAVVVHLGVFGAFHIASSDPWLRPTPQALQA